MRPEHVVALRLYTTAAFGSINDPLRCSAEDRSTPYRFPTTVNLINEGIKRLRAVGAEDLGPSQHMTLWRGLRDVRLPPAFLSQGGTEMAPMSTTPRLDVAVRYSASVSSVLMKITTHSFMERGADLTFLSCFPAEAEILFPPLTYLQPVGEPSELLISDLDLGDEVRESLMESAKRRGGDPTAEIRYTVLEVIPKI